MYTHTENCSVYIAINTKIPEESYPNPIVLFCQQCGKKMLECESRSHLKFCSVDCYKKSLLLDEDQIRRMVRMGKNRNEAAIILGLTYQTFRRKLIKQGLNDLFARYPHKFNE